MIDRSKFKSTKVADVQHQEKEVAAMTKTKNDRAGYLKIEPGKNVFRVFPPHPVAEGEVGGISFVEPKSTVWLPMMVEERDTAGQLVKGQDGKTVMKKGNKSVFNSRIHGNTEKDLVEEYFKMAEAWAKAHKFDADSKEDAKKRKAYTDKIWGNFATKVQGIRYNHNWVMFAKKLSDSKTPFGLVELRPSMKDGINKVVNMEASNQPVGTEANDPFTDLDEGRALVIVYNDKADKPADYYTVSIDTSTEAAEINGRKVQIQKVHPLTDDDLEMLTKFPSLYKTFRNCFKKRDFLLQYEGLEFFDKENGMGIFNSQEFQDVISEIVEYYPDDAVPTAEEVAEVVNAETEDEVVEETEEVDSDTDQFALMNRDELKKFATDNKTGILVKPSMTEEMLRERLREWKEVQAGGVDEATESSEEAAIETPVAEVKKEEVVTPPTTSGMSAKDKLKALKERQAAKA